MSSAALIGITLLGLFLALVLLNLVFRMPQKSGTGFCQRSGRELTAIDNQRNCFVFKLFLHEVPPESD